jgi:hypothetical protein
MGEIRTDRLFHQLLYKGQNAFFQAKYSEARTVYEECYDLVAIAYYPDHPQVLRIATLLIDILIQLKEYYDAERYVRILYECITRPIDTESDDVANAAISLATITFKLVDQKGPEGGDVVEAEMLARKCIRIKEKVFGVDHVMIVETLNDFFCILQLKENSDDKSIELLEKCLAISVKFSSVNNNFVPKFNFKLAEIHFKLGKFQPTIKTDHLPQAVRINTLLYGLTHPNMIAMELLLSNLL